MSLDKDEKSMQKQIICTGFRADTRFYFSQVHLRTAVLFAQMSKKIEANTRQTQRDREMHWSYVVTSVMTSVAFIEAAINEVYSDAAEDMKYQNMAPDVTGKLAAIWQIESFRRGASLLEKYQVALRLADKTEFNKGEAPCQDVVLVVRLRNALVHFVPQTVTVGASPGLTLDRGTHELEKCLKGKFPLNPLALKIKQGGGIKGVAHFETDFVAPFFPDECLGYGCAKWAFGSCLAFTDKFFAEMNVTPYYATMRSKYASKV